MRRAPALIGVFALLLSATTLSAQTAVPAPEAGKCSLVFIGFEPQIEAGLADSTILKMEDVPIGVTKPQRATIDNGMRFAWKQLTPGFNKGYFESYKSEIAAYKIDQFLEMHMVPPIVERNIQGKYGAAVYWVENTRPWSIKAPPQGPEPMWSRQLTKMKMLDLLIANIDRNQGNLIYDADWHLVLIDHSRAFIDKKDLKGLAPLGRVDKKLWERMQALTMEDLDRVLGKWVDEKGKKAMLIRRDLMAKTIDELIKKRGANSVFYPDAE